MSFPAVGSNASNQITGHEKKEPSSPISSKDKKVRRLAEDSIIEKTSINSDKKIEKPKVKTEKKSEAMAKRSTEDWVCTDRKKGDKGGYIYKLELKGTKDKSEHLREFFCGPLSRRIVDENDNNLLSALGFKIEGRGAKTVLYLPDKHELEARLKTLIKHNSFLKDFNIYNGSEPRDRSLSEAFSHGQVVLSTDHFLLDNEIFLNSLERHILEGPLSDNVKLKDFATSYQNIKDARHIYDKGKGDPEIEKKIEVLESFYGQQAQKLFKYPRLKGIRIENIFYTIDSNKELDDLIKQKGLSIKSYDLMREVRDGKLIIPLQSKNNKTNELTKTLETESSKISKEKDLENKCGHLFDCVSRKPFNGGFVYQFKQKQVNNEEEIVEKIFPAIEPNSLAPGYLPSTTVDHHFNKKINSVLCSLGYDMKVTDEGIMVIDLPNRVALINSWNKAREKDPTLPQIEIVNSAGIASDLDFYKVYSEGKLLLSDGVEFMHDHSTHIISALVLMIESVADPTIEKNLQRIKTNLDLVYQKITNAKEAYKNAGKLDKHHEKMFEMMEFVLGANVDLISSFLSPDVLNDIGSEFINDHFNSIWSQPIWDKYIEGRFGKERPTEEELKDLWFNINTQRLPQ